MYYRNVYAKKKSDSEIKFCWNIFSEVINTWKNWDQFRRK